MTQKRLCEWPTCGLDLETADFCRPECAEQECIWPDCAITGEWAGAACEHGKPFPACQKG